MKRILIFALLVIFSSTITAQTRIVANKAMSGKWNIYTKEYEIVDEVKEVNIPFIFYETYIQVEDEARSVYRIIKTLPKRITNEVEILSASCLDENNVKCIVSLMSYISYNELHILVHYSNIAYFISY